MANDAPDFKALSATTEQTPPSLIDEALNHSRETWRNVTTGNASAGQYTEAAVEALTVTAVGAFLYTRNRNLANSFVHNVDSALQLSDDVANPGLLAQIRAAAKGTKPVSHGGRPFTETSPLSELGEVQNPALLAQIRAASKGTEQVAAGKGNPILVHPDTGAPLLHPDQTKKSRLEALTHNLPEEINFGDEAANQALLATGKPALQAAAKRPTLLGRVQDAAEDEHFSMFNFDNIPISSSPSTGEQITSIVKRNLE